MSFKFVGGGDLRGTGGEERIGWKHTTLKILKDKILYDQNILY